MNKRLQLTASGLIPLIMLVSASVASADVVVSGEAKAYSSAAAQLQVSVEARGGDGAASGAVHYTRLTPGGSPELELDMSVSCIWVSEDAQRVVMAGPADITSNSRSATVGEWFVVAIQKKPAEKERVRALFATQREAAAKCAGGETAFPAIVDSGGFTITNDDAGAAPRNTNIDPDIVGGSRDFPLPDPGIDIDRSFNGSGTSGGSNTSRCAAHYRFDGNLEDSTGNDHDAIMVDLDRLPTGQPGEYTDGKRGSALHLTGDSVAVSTLDLHFEACPKITVTAWVMLKSEPTQQMTVLSTGYGSGPRLAIAKSNMSAWGGVNEIRTRSRDWVPPVGEWLPVVATWDYEMGTHTLYIDGTPLKEGLGNYSREPQQDLWIGAYAYGSKLMNIASDILVDDLRVYDRILDATGISAALADELSVAQCDCN